MGLLVTPSPCGGRDLDAPSLRRRGSRRPPPRRRGAAAGRWPRGQHTDVSQICAGTPGASSPRALTDAAARAVVWVPRALLAVQGLTASCPWPSRRPSAGEPARWADRRSSGPLVTVALRSVGDGGGQAPARTSCTENVVRRACVRSRTGAGQVPGGLAESSWGGCRVQPARRLDLCLHHGSSTRRLGARGSYVRRPGA